MIMIFSKNIVSSTHVYRVLEQLKRDHTRVISPEHAPFISLNDVIDRLLPYHVFQGEPPCEEDFAKGMIVYTLKPQ